MELSERLALIHDMVGRLGTIKSSATLIKNGKISDEDKEYLLDAIIQRVNELDKVLDQHFINLKNSDNENI
jgi:hypothetical protein